VAQGLLISVLVVNLLRRRLAERSLRESEKRMRLDVTARKEAEDRARESEGKFLMMANSAPVLIWASGTDKKCTFLNLPWLNFTGRTLEQELGHGWAEGVHAEDRSRCLKTYSEAFDARRPFLMEYRLRRHDGEYRWIADQGVPRYDSDRNFLGYIGSCVDVTERRRAETEAQRSRDELAHMSRVTTLGELGGSLAHELNQPLTAILSNAQAASRYLDNGHSNLNEVREILHDIVEEDRRAGEIITRMRAMLKKEEAKMLPQDLNRIIGEVLGIMRSEFLIRNVTPITRLADGLPEVKGDRVQLQQVLLNLIVNACEAMAAVPPPTRQMTIQTEKVDGSLVQVTVADQGPGFGTGASAYKFEAFQTTKPDGLGLGLPICRSIVESHGGRLWCGNNNGPGAVVRFTVLINSQAKP
jgi:PAS domain S-box-containing protein